MKKTMKFRPKVSKDRAVKASRNKVSKGLVFIGARKSGSQVTVSREITGRSAAGRFAIIESTKSKLPKPSSAGKDKSAPKDWMQNPQLGHRLAAAFGKAVAAAKRGATKPHE